MTWANQWSYKVDGVELNDRVNYICQIPELSNMPQMDLIMAQLAGDYPVMIRAQPAEGRLTFNIALYNVTDAQFDTKLALLKGYFVQGARHQLAVQARGMDASKTVYFYTEGIMVDYRARLVSVRTIAPKPTLA